MWKNTTCIISLNVPFNPFIYFKEQMIENEVSILRKVDHPNIILLKDEYDTKDELYLVMELVRVS